jgi:Arc/MetJ family transcription regulator
VLAVLAVRTYLVALVVWHYKWHQLMIIFVIMLKGSTMRTTLALDDDLLAKATALTGVAEKTALVREALRALIQRESAKRLALLGGSMPMLEDVPRRQVEPT